MTGAVAAFLSSATHFLISSHLPCSLSTVLTSGPWPTAAVGLNLLFGQSREVIKAVDHSFSSAV